MIKANLDYYGRPQRYSDLDRATGIGFIRLLSPDFRKEELNNMIARDRRYVVAGLKWTLFKLGQHRIAKGKLASACAQGARDARLCC